MRSVLMILVGMRTLVRRQTRYNINICAIIVVAHALASAFISLVSFSKMVMIKIKPGVDGARMIGRKNRMKKVG
jgi:hypothetical protein